MNSKHTPGPWHIASPSKFYEAIGATDVMAGDKNIAIASLANARLIAAAPDLFESIIDLVEAVTTAINAGDWKVDGACDPDAALERSLRAIAKASGETWTTTS